MRTTACFDRARFAMALVPESFPIQPGTGSSPCKGERPIRALLFDTYGTVCDFWRPLGRAFARFAAARGLALDSGRLAIEWRGAYARSTFLAAGFGLEFRPLKQLHRENLLPLLAAQGIADASEDEIRTLLDAWNRLDPWPDTVPGLEELARLAIVAPLSNGNFDDMVALARHAGLRWDIILGSSVARAYKPHPDIYRRSVEALALEPGDCCMVAAHQIDLAYAAGHGLQTAFVIRREEFGGAVRARDAGSEASLDAAEVEAEGDWTFVAESFLDLAAQLRETSGRRG